MAGARRGLLPAARASEYRFGPSGFPTDDRLAARACLFPRRLGQCVRAGRDSVSTVMRPELSSVLTPAHTASQTLFFNPFAVLPNAIARLLLLGVASPPVLVV